MKRFMFGAYKDGELKFHSLYNSINEAYCLGLRIVEGYFPGTEYNYFPVEHEMVKDCNEIRIDEVEFDSYSLDNFAFKRLNNENLIDIYKKQLIEGEEEDVDYDDLEYYLKEYWSTHTLEDAKFEDKISLDEYYEETYNNCGA